jgi:integrase
MNTNNVLLRGGYAKSTQSMYSRAVIRFSTWCDEHGFTLLTNKQLDNALSSYFLHLYTSGLSKNEAAHALYGLDMMIPGIRTSLVLSRRSLRGFNRLVPSFARPPISWHISIAIALWLTFRGKYDIAIGMLLSFDCYLRINELLSLVVDDFAVGNDARLGLTDVSSICLHLRHTKTGPNKGVMMVNPHVKALVLFIIARKPPHHRVFTFSASTYRRWLHRACFSLQLPSYTPHSFRHGAATHDFMHGMAMADILVRGRWVATKSASHYIQSGRQLMMLQHIPQWINDIGHLASSHLVMSMDYALSQYTS